MIVLGIGSNCGHRLNYLRKAIQKLRKLQSTSDLKIIKISPIYESDALLPENAPENWNKSYLNINILCETRLSPKSLLEKLKSIEIELGRQKREKWAPREIDIDVLSYDSLVLDTLELSIPHPSLLDRPFALLPFVDLLPHWTWPKPGPFFGKEISHLASAWRNRSWETVPFRTRRSQFHLPALMGILNITPDSFSDGGLYYSLQNAEKQITSFLNNSIEIIDLGAESTRPGSQAVEPKSEWARLQPIFKFLCSHESTIQAHNTQPIKISVDTRHSEVATQAIQAGAHWINDVTGFEDPRMREAVASSSSVELVMMHSLSIPPHGKFVLNQDNDPIEEILDWAQKRVILLNQSGISSDRIILDPGIGFGKTAKQSWEILRRAHELHQLGLRVLIGHSRKSFFSQVTDQPYSERDIETLTLSVDLAAKGVDYLRIHNAEMHSRGLKTWFQANGITQCRT